jgi:hypothetical protein
VALVSLEVTLSGGLLVLVSILSFIYAWTCKANVLYMLLPDAMPGATFPFNFLAVKPALLLDGLVVRVPLNLVAAWTYGACPFKFCCWIDEWPR